MTRNSLWNSMTKDIIISNKYIAYILVSVSSLFLPMINFRIFYFPSNYSTKNSSYKNWYGKLFILSLDRGCWRLSNEENANRYILCWIYSCWRIWPTPPVKKLWLNARLIAGFVHLIGFRWIPHTVRTDPLLFKTNMQKSMWISIFTLRSSCTTEESSHKG